jgi:hypothetical protein
MSSVLRKHPDTKYFEVSLVIRSHYKTTRRGDKTPHMRSSSYFVNNDKNRHYIHKALKEDSDMRWKITIKADIRKMCFKIFDLTECEI